jgi:hypothetical protein
VALFAGWAVLIATAAWVAERGEDREEGGDADAESSGTDRQDV